MKKLLNKKVNKGITLIALVITIVVLIILAGVIISITLGNGGIVDRAKIAKQEYANAQDYEELGTASLTDKIDDIVQGYRSLSSPIVLWQNEDPTVSFAAQTIHLSSDDYDYLEIYYLQWPRFKSTYSS